MKRIYLDYSATTPIDEVVLDSMLPFLKDKFGNPSSIHFWGQQTRSAIETARETIADVINAKPKEIYFTSGGTEAINFAIIGSAFTIREETGKNQIITSSAEHHATLSACEYLKKFGFEINYINPELNGLIDLKKVLNVITEKSALISLMHVNNETGAILDIFRLSEISKKYGTALHVDAVQSYCKFSIDVDKLNIDYLSASSHKIFGPKGIGFLYVRTGSPINPIILGGSQERNRRGGTENTPAIIGFAKASELFSKNRTKYFNDVIEIKNYFLKKLTDYIGKEILINSPLENCSPYILNISLNPEQFKINSDSLMINFDMEGIAISNGSACSSGTIEPSHVLLSMGLSKERANTAMRFSFSKLTTKEEIDYTILTLKKIIERFKSPS